MKRTLIGVVVVLVACGGEPEPPDINVWRADVLGVEAAMDSAEAHPGDMNVVSFEEGGTYRFATESRDTPTEETP